MSATLPGPDESLDPLVGDWRIFQLRKGHRFSVDDMVTAWRAVRARPEAAALLDLGCGIGSVGLTALWHLPADARLVGLEAQAISAGLARRTVALNGVGDRVQIVHGDLRDAAALPAALIPPGGFPLITGSPPYLPESAGIVPSHPQKAGARFELRGSVFDYCHAAARWLAPGGRFAFVMLAGDPRTEAAPTRAGLAVVERLDVVFREGRDPHIAVLVCGHASEIGDAPRRTSRLTIRDHAGQETPEILAFRAELSGDGPAARARRAER